MKKTAILLATLVAGTVLSAQDHPTNRVRSPGTGTTLGAQEPSSSYTITVDFPYASEYVFRGVKLANDSFQPSVEIAKDNWYAGVWTNQPITNNTDNEIDFYAGMGLPLNDTWSVDTGASLYYYPELNKSTGLDSTTVEGYVGITGTVSGFTPSFYTYYDFTLETWAFQGSVGYSIPLSNKVSLDLTGTVGLVEPNAGSNYAYYGVGAVVPFKLTDKATASLGLQYATTDISGSDDELYVTAGITIGL